MVPLGRPGQRDDGDGEGERGQLQGSEGCFGGSPLGPGRSRVPRNLPRTLHRPSKPDRLLTAALCLGQRVQGLLQF